MTGHKETVGEAVTVKIADHAPRKDSPEYSRTRKWLMGKAGGGCFICGGPPDMSHPEIGSSKGLQDHHGGGIYVNAADGTPVLVALNLFPMEWSEGFGASPERVEALVGNLNKILEKLGEATYDKPLKTDAQVMDYVDSPYNANVKLCSAHHLGHPKKSTPDINGHQAVGIHNIPGPIMFYQGYCDWEHWDMFAGTTGTVAVAPDPDNPGHARVLHVADDASDEAKLVKEQSTDQGGEHPLLLPPGSDFLRAALKTDKYA